jgi:arginyl-tRNA synthetase
MIKNQIKQLINKIIKQEFSELSDFSSFSVGFSQNNNFGDYSTNAAMILAKELKQNPMEIGEVIVAKLQSDEVTKGIIKKIEIIKPGFINFYLSHGYLQNQTKEILDLGDKFGKSDLGKDLKVNIEFISANPTGPLHIGNARGGFCGDTLANVFKAYGAKVDREYYINDRGKQINDLGHSVLKDNDAVYKGEYIDELKTKSEKLKIKAEDIGNWATNEILNESIKKTIEKMSIKYDIFFSEKSLYEDNKVILILDLLEKDGYLENKDNALWFKSTQFDDDKDRVIKRSNGEYTYFASDIAYHTDKINRGYDLCIDFWGADHAGYVSRLKSVTNEILKKELNWSGKLETILFQLVRLIKDGKEFRMSKREGNVIFIDDLLNEVPLDVARFFFLMHSYNTHMDFDLDLAKERSQKNPVYYVQYAYARISSILANSKLKTQNSKLNENLTYRSSTPRSLRLEEQTGNKLKIENLGLLKTDYELDLIKTLIKLPELVEEIVGDYQVHRLTHYAREIADKFHAFYENCKVIDNENIEITNARLALCEATKIVLKNTLSLMGISTPEKM